jgi:putative exosortase-associated protein (TIGR04073 family)
MAAPGKTIAMNLRAVRKALYKDAFRRKLKSETQSCMRKLSLFFAASVAAAGLTGCQGPEEKLSRGLENTLEVVRLGEIRASVEQSAVFSSPEVTYTYGLVHGFDQMLKRVGLGVYETATFLIPNYTFADNSWNYGPILTSVCRYVDGVPVVPEYPDSYRPGIISESTFDTDTYTGMTGGDVAPFVPGSRFKIFGD